MIKVTDNHKQVTGISSFILEVAKGTILGHSIMSAMGERENMGSTANIRTSGEDVWRGNDSGVGGAVFIPDPPLLGEQMTVVSSSIEDMPSAILTFTGNALNGETVTIGTKTYKFQTILTNVDGNILIGETITETISNFVNAILTGPMTNRGTVYAVAMTAQPQGISASTGAANTIVFMISSGTPVSTETLTNASFASGNMAAKTGVPVIHIEYLDSDGFEAVETMNLNGASDVNTIYTDGIFVNDLHSKHSIPLSTAAGNVTIRSVGGATTLIYNMIGIRGNKGLVPKRMIPANKSLILKGWNCSEVQDKRNIYRIRATAFNGIREPGSYHFKGNNYVKMGQSGQLILNEKLPPMTVISIAAWADQTLAEGSCSWWGILIDN